MTRRTQKIEWQPALFYLAIALFIMVCLPLIMREVQGRTSGTFLGTRVTLLMVVNPLLSLIAGFLAPRFRVPLWVTVVLPPFAHLCSTLFFKFSAYLDPRLLLIYAALTLPGVLFTLWRRRARSARGR